MESLTHLTYRNIGHQSRIRRERQVGLNRAANVELGAGEGLNSCGNLGQIVLRNKGRVSEVTRILDSSAQGDAKAAEELLQKN